MTSNPKTNASAALVRFFTLYESECRSLFTAQFFCWDSTVDRFLFLLTMSPTSRSSDPEKTFDLEGSEIYYIAEVETEENDSYAYQHRKR